jgi:hypothetical protein
MLSLLARLFPASRARAAAPTSKPLPEVVTLQPGGPSFNGTPVARYPAPGNVIQTVPPRMLLDTQQTIIDQIRQSLGMPQADFDVLVYPVLERFAAWVQLMPASQSHHHCTQGGMLRHGLEVAFYSARITQGMVFAIEVEPKRRRLLEPRYCLAAALGGLLHDLGKVLVDMAAADAKGTIEWDCCSMPLYDWLVENDLPHYKVFWKPGERHGKHERFAALAAREIIGAATLRWLVSDGGKEVSMHLWEVLSGIKTNLINPLSQLVIKADMMSVEADQEEMKKEMYSAGGGRQKSVAIRLLHAVEKVVREQARRPNEPGQLVYYGDLGVFCQFPEILVAAAAIVRAEGAHDDAGIPNSPTDLASILLDATFITRHTSPTMNISTVWDISIDLANGNVFSMQAIRFDRPEMVFGDTSLPAKIAIRTGVQAMPPTPSSILSTLPIVPSPVAVHSVDSSQPVPMLGVADTSLPVIENRRESDLDAQQYRTRTSDSPDRIAVMATKEDVAGWLRQNHKAGLFLTELANRASQGSLVRWRRDIDIDGGRVVAVFPDVFAGMGMAPPDILEVFKSARWLEQDIGSPDKLTVKAVIGDKTRNGIRFVPAASQAITVLSPPDAAPVAVAPDALHPEQKPVEPPKQLQSGREGDASDAPAPVPAAATSTPTPNASARQPPPLPHDLAFMRVVAYRYLKVHFPQLTELSDLSPGAVKSKMNELHKAHLRDVFREDEWWDILQDSPHALITVMGAGAVPKYQVSSFFDPTQIGVPSEFYTRYPTLLHFPAKGT